MCVEIKAVFSIRPKLAFFSIRSLRESFGFPSRSLENQVAQCECATAKLHHCTLQLRHHHVLYQQHYWGFKMMLRRRCDITMSSLFRYVFVEGGSTPVITTCFPIKPSLVCYVYVVTSVFVCQLRPGYHVMNDLPNNNQRASQYPEKIR